MLMRIEEYEERLRVAMLRSDVAELDVLIDDELLFVGPAGGLHTKDDDLQLHRSGSQRMSQADWQAVEVRPCGTTTCITAVTAQLSGTFMDQPFSGRFRYLRTWALREGRWRVVAGSVSAIAVPDA
ncbi:MAG TPA: nuclear transport factor 2 family protein [Stenotrophomonas sp.]|nr:nuclear transport factor 2 family protein [Stenotrophomonas sp.]